MPSARRRIDPAHRGQRGKPNGHPQAADGKNSGTQALQKRRNQAYAAQRAQALRNFRNIFAHLGTPANRITALCIVSAQNQGGSRSQLRPISAREPGTAFAQESDCAFGPYFDQ